jgi:hypothetical protein
MVTAENGDDDHASTCSECGKQIYSFHLVQEDILCTECYENIPLIDHSSCLDPPTADLAAGTAQNNKPDIIQKIVACLLSVAATIYGSFHFSAYAVTATISGGHPSAWGMEYLVCFFAPIPGIIGFAIAYMVFLRNQGIGSRCVLSAASGVAAAFLAMMIFGMVVTAPRRSEAKKTIHQTQDELSYFRKAIEGKCQDDEIREHYKKSPLTHHAAQQIRQELYNATQAGDFTRPKSLYITTIEPKTLPVLIEALESDPGIVGFLVALPDVPLELKQKIADSKESPAVKYLASDVKTPPGILLKLATHPSTEVARNVFYNKNAPAAARYIYSIRAPFSEDWRHHNEGNTPPGYGSDEERSVWRKLVTDNRDYVRTWVARSRVTPPQILSALADDNNKVIVQWVLLNNNSSQQVRNKAAHRLSSSASDVISALGKSNDREIRAAVARSRDTTDPALKELIHDREESVRRAVTENPRVSPELLEALGNDYSTFVLAAVAQNPKTPVATLKKLLSKSVDMYNIPGVAAENLRSRGQKL